MNQPYMKVSKLTETAIVPTKSLENSGYDLFADIQTDYFINAHTTRLVPTSIAIEIPYDWTFVIKERGSTGSKGIKVSSGIIDPSFRGNIFVAICNSTYKTVVISINPDETLKRLIKMREQDLRKEHGENYNAEKGNPDRYVEKNYIIYPAQKAIAQGLLIYTPHVEPQVVDYSELSTSERGTDCLGSTNK